MPRSSRQDLPLWRNGRPNPLRRDSPIDSSLILVAKHYYIKRMAMPDLISIGEAAGLLGVGVEQTRRYVRNGDLPAVRFGNSLAVPRAFVLGLRHGRPSRGRPLSPRNCWEKIAAGEVDIDGPSRYRNRGTLSRWHVNSGDLSEAAKHPGVIVSGVAAGHHYGALLAPLPDAGALYLRESAFADPSENPHGPLGAARGGDPFASVEVRVVADDVWDIALQACAESAGTRFAPPAAAALDLATSPDPREQDVAAWLIEELTTT